MQKTKYAPESEKTTPPITLSDLKRAWESGEILEAPAVLCDSSLNLKIALGGELYGIIPREEAVFEMFGIKTRDIAVVTRVGKTVCFKVKNLRGSDIILSRAMAQEECKREYIDKLRAGDIIPAKITHMEPFGAFTDIGCGIPALLPLDFISVSRISHPSDRLRMLECVRAVVAGIDPDNGRITLSLRELQGTWLENAASFKAGETVAGIIRGSESYGVFIELTPNLAGLAEPLAQTEGMTALPVGSRCAVYIKSIIPERMKVKLVIVDCQSPNGTAAGFAPPRYIVPESACRVDMWQYSPPQAPPHKTLACDYR